MRRWCWCCCPLPCFGPLTNGAAAMLTLDTLIMTKGDFALTADWQADEGARIAVIGPSGAGKSTLLSVIGGFFAAQSGRVLWQGADLTRGRPRRAAHHHAVPRSKPVSAFDDCAEPWAGNFTESAADARQIMPGLTRHWTARACRDWSTQTGAAFGRAAKPGGTGAGLAARQADLAAG